MADVKKFLAQQNVPTPSQGTSQNPSTQKISVPVTVNPNLTELGRSGLKQSAGYIYEEFLTNLRWPRAGEIYQEMSSNDPVVTAMLLVSKQLFRNVSWSVKEASSSSEDMSAAAFVRECMDDMSTTWLDFVEEITSYFEYGWAYHEIVYKRRNGYKRNEDDSSKFADNRIGWRRMPGRSQVSLASWDFDDDTGRFKGMIQATEQKDVLIPVERALLFRTTTARGNPEGKSFLRGAYRPWYFKKHIEEIEGIGIERDLAGLPVVVAPEGVDIFNVTENEANIRARNAAMAMVSSIRNDRNAGIVLPFGWDLKLLSSGSTRQFDTSSIIGRYDQRIAITMLADIVMLGADKVGSFALAKVKQSLLATCLDAQLKSIVDILNRQAIPRLFAYNTFPGITDFPRFETGTVLAPDLAELGDYIKKLSDSGMNFFNDPELESYLRQVAGLPQRSDEFQPTQQDSTATSVTQVGQEEEGNNGN